MFTGRPCQVLGHSPIITLPLGNVHLWISVASDELAEMPNAIAIATMYFVIVLVHFPPVWFEKNPRRGRGGSSYATFAAPKQLTIFWTNLHFFK
jgi:hypothetical protein